MSSVDALMLPWVVGSALEIERRSRLRREKRQQEKERKMNEKKVDRAVVEGDVVLSSDGGRVTHLRFHTTEHGQIAELRNLSDAQVENFVLTLQRAIVDVRAIQARGRVHEKKGGK